MELFYTLLVLLLTARVLGEIAERLGQPALLGEIVAGVVVGIAVRSYGTAFPVLAGLSDDPVFIAVTELGMFFLMLHAGLEMRPQELAAASGRALGVAVSGLLLPLGLGALVGWWFLPDSELRSAQILFLGVALAVTAVPVSVRVLMDLGQMQSAVGRMIVSAALFDDVSSLVLLAVLTAVAKTGSLPAATGFASLLLQVAVFLSLAAAVGHWGLPRIGAQLRKLRIPDAEFSFLLAVGLAFAVFAERFGMHFIIGAFLAGLFFVRRTIDPETHRDVAAKVSALTHGFLAPILRAGRARARARFGRLPIARRRRGQGARGRSRGPRRRPQRAGELGRWVWDERPRRR